MGRKKRTKAMVFPVSDMAAPDRAFEVKMILGTQRVYPKTEKDEGRRSNLFTIIRRLNSMDLGFWGCLVKTDQGGKIPGDIIVWKPTMEHFDVISGDGQPVWIPHGPITYAPWVWREVLPDGQPIPEPDPVEPDEPEPEIPPYPGDHIGWQIGEALLKDAQQASQTLNAGSGVWFLRIGYDYLRGGLSIEDSIAKHRAEWRAVLGLPPV